MGLTLSDSPMSTSDPPVVVFASRNPGKLAEVQDALDSVQGSIRSLAQLGLEGEVDETGGSYADNAAIKAVHWSLKSGLPTLADDSGLEVDALDGAPGVRSARYGGEGLDDRQRNLLLLEALRGVPPEQRGACFRCVLVVAVAGRVVLQAEGSRRGLILGELRGSAGFGYDPLFYVPELGAAFGELPSEVKRAESHRARALRVLEQALLERGGWPREAII
jgi:XTP/dITP diphosphohydrolase